MLNQRVWIPILLFLFALRVVVLIRRQGDVTTLDIYSLVQIAIILLLTFAILFQPYLQSALRAMLRPPGGFFLAIYVIGVLSATWSEIPKLSGFFAYQGLVLVVAAVVFFYQQMLRGNLERAALWMSMVLLLMNVVGHARVHMVGFNLESWHTNSYSAVAAMLAAYCLGELWSARGKLDKRRRRLLKTCLVIALFFLVLGTSGGSNVAFALGVIGALLYSAKRKLKAFAIPLIAVAVVVYLVIPEFLVAVLLPGKTMESVETLTGRTRIWELYWDMFLANPILGVGFGVPERVASLYTTNTHNIVIGIAASLGMFGLTFFLLYLFSLAKRLLGMHSKVGYAGVACAIGVGLANGMTVGFLTSGSGPAFMAFAIWNAVLVLKPLAVERETREQESRPAEVGPAAWPRTASQRAR